MCVCVCVPFFESPLETLLSRPYMYMRQLLLPATRQHYCSCILCMEILNATFYKLLENRQPVYFQATCRMYHAIFPCAPRTNNNVAVSLVTKVASYMVGFKRIPDSIAQRTDATCLTMSSNSCSGL